MQKEVFSGLKLDNGEPIYTQEYIQSLRDTDKKHPDKLKIIAQRGGQERMLSIDADIKIVGGSRGGSKSFSSLMEVLKDIKNPDFHATILRNEKDDLQSLVTDSYKLFSRPGTSITEDGSSFRTTQEPIRISKHDFRDDNMHTSASMRVPSAHTRNSNTS